MKSYIAVANDARFHDVVVAVREAINATNLSLSALSDSLIDSMDDHVEDVCAYVAIAKRARRRVKPGLPDEHTLARADAVVEIGSRCVGIAAEISSARYGCSAASALAMRSQISRLVADLEEV